MNPRREGALVDTVVSSAEADAQVSSYGLTSLCGSPLRLLRARFDVVDGTEFPERRPSAGP